MPARTPSTRSSRPASSASSRQKLAGLLVFSTDVQSLTLPVAQGLVLTESFYWDLNDETRARTKPSAPSATDPQHADGRRLQLGHALPHSRAGGGHRRRQAVMAKMRRLGQRVRTKNGKLREDGRLVRDMPVRGQVAGGSKGKDDIYKPLATVPGEEAFRPPGMASARS
jgi:branched-chain amino acid transport system substrate-binding protein